MKKITLAIIVVSVILVGACLVSAHSPERPLPDPHDAAIDSIYASGVTHPQGSDLRLDLVLSSIQHNFLDMVHD
jgi:hypothetical protein